MDVNKSISKWRCKEHPKYPCELICLDENSKNRVVCFNCVQKQSIPFSNLISMSCVLEANQHDILQAYPPLKDQELSDRLRETNLQLHLEEIEVYFKKLIEDFEKEVKAAEQRAKQALIKQEKACQELLEEYTRIAEVERLKDLIVSEKENAEKDLDDFVKEKWKKAEENRKVMEDLINQYEKVSQFSSDEANKITQEIIKSLKNINFFQQPILEPQITMIKSTFNTSQQMEITKINKSIYQIKKGTQNGWDQVFIDPIINPLQKYILHIELEQKQGNSGNNFFFGLVKEEGKDNREAFSQRMCYYDYSIGYGITKRIKGSPMESGFFVSSKRCFEVRIYLNQKFLRVASLPGYSSIAELDDPNKIDPKVDYRFFLSMFYFGDMMRITDMRTVSEFDEKM